MTLFDDLRAHRAATADRHILDLFRADPDRFARFSARLDDMVLDFSKTSIDEAALDLLLRLARERGVEARRDAMFAGERINQTEGRAVLHTALRNRSDRAVTVDGQDVTPGIRATLERMAAFATGIRSGAITAPSGARFTDVVNIGIGGSDLGPVMAALALAPWHDGPRTHFVSNVDGAHVHDVLKGLDPRTTLVIVASKTFTTIETMTNARTARHWVEAAVGAAAGGHFAALSSALDRTAEFGIEPDRVFGFEDWVGGRYSMWGPIGLSVMIAVGPEVFGRFLDGGFEMDEHFRTAPLAENLPVLLGLVGIWHNNACGYPTRAVLPYDQRLLRLPAYLQQLDMESNGKRVALDGSPLTEASGPVVWGEPGTNGQHAFYQLIHQGTAVIPCEFLVAAEGHEPDLRHQHDLLVANCLAQSEALLVGRPTADNPHRVFPGNRPSTTLMYRQLTPETFGRIVALYEHRVFVEGAIWGINSFDQWGVELGKELATQMLPLIEGKGDAAGKDGSTAGLLGTLSDLRG
ncbi:glucose-6-phosphate isomerase [Halovulum dunhuangense]|uniref:Glucose-6-phosphate isomerase n=1 Tax=Halovulum dunhuangense TaxID=1505036 RepID=A0A849L033_9RHOB|nr:glucose-6-phosphate isomerase [Halovulum dunhuangense]NNU79010.1 glucose-6-phosphate isomerase [Halovulum dunhuangense]